MTKAKTMSNSIKPQTFAARPNKVQAIQFNGGDSGKAIVKWINDHTNPDYVQTARNGGRYISLTTLTEKETIVYGDVVCFDPQYKTFFVYGRDLFKERYRVLPSHNIQ